MMSAKQQNNKNQVSPTRSINEYLAKMGRQYNYHISQHNGQRMFGPPKGEPPMSLNYQHEIFIANIPEDCFEDKLLEFFLDVEGLYTFRYMLDYSGNGRGFAFAKYKTIESANYARIKFCNLCIMGKHLRVLPCKNKAVIVIGNLDIIQIGDCGGPYDSVLRYCLSTFGTIIRIALRRRQHLIDYLVEFCEHRDAALARRHLKSNKSRLFGQRCYICWDWQVQN